MARPTLQRRAGWQHLADAAASHDRELRQLALTRAYAWVEHALDAAGVLGPRRPIANRILRTFEKEALSRGLSDIQVKAAITIRHKSTHEDSVPDESQCVTAIKTFRGVWHALSR